MENVENITIRRTITKEKIKTPQNYFYGYLQAILNSVLIKFYVNELMYDGTHFYPNHMKQLPIKKSTEFNQKPFVELVDKILNITKTDDYLKNIEKQAEVKKLEYQIDELVYKLYDLSPEEIEIVENSSKK